MPNVYVYAANNPSESILAKRRGYGTIISHNVSSSKQQQQQQQQQQQPHLPFLETWACILCASKQASKQRAGTNWASLARMHAVVILTCAELRATASMEKQKLVCSSVKNPDPTEEE